MSRKKLELLQNRERITPDRRHIKITERNYYNFKYKCKNILLMIVGKKINTTQAVAHPS